MAVEVENADELDFDVVVVGGGISGLYCARELARARRRVVVLEATSRFGGRIETAELSPPPYPATEPFVPHKAEFGPMRFELEIQPLFAELLEELGVSPDPFAGPRSPEPPVEFPVAEDERAPGDVPLPALELLKLGIFRLFGMDAIATLDADQNPVAELNAAGRGWLRSLTETEAGFEELRQQALMPGTGDLLVEHGFWNALYSQLSPMAVAKILHFGTFYHLMPDNPNAAEWAIFWLRLFQLEGDSLSTLKSGVQTVSDAMVADLQESTTVVLKPDHRVVALRPAATRVEVDVSNGQRFVADQVVLAVPKHPLELLASDFPEQIRRDLQSVTAFPLLKVFCVTETPPWWRGKDAEGKDNWPSAQEGAWNAPTREVHYLPAKPREKPGTAPSGWTPPDQTLVLFYTDRPATAYWQPYLVWPDSHNQAEVNQNPDLKKALAAVLFNMHWAWAKDAAGLGARTGQDALSTPKGQRIMASLRPFARLIEEIDESDPVWRKLAAKHPGLVGDPARIIFHSNDVLEWQRSAIGDYAIRDWSRPPFGAGCHAWAPRARSWEVRARLASFGFSGHEDVQNLHVCGEAYSDYQGFIEGALRSARDALKTM